MTSVPYHIETTQSVCAYWSTPKLFKKQLQAPLRKKQPLRECRKTSTVE